MNAFNAVNKELNVTEDIKLKGHGQRVTIYKRKLSVFINRPHVLRASISKWALLIDKYKCSDKVIQAADKLRETNSASSAVLKTEITGNSASSVCERQYVSN